jgi:uncharacterized metal-binding protein YceD (DUF177 family)
MQQKMTFQPKALALAEQEMKGTIPIAQLPRLKTALTGDDGEIRFTIAGRKNGDRLVVDLLMGGEVTLRCDRCLDTFNLPLRHSGCFWVVDDAVKADEEDLEHDYLAAEDVIDVWGWLEDEAILSLPFAAFHPECAA